MLLAIDTGNTQTMVGLYDTNAGAGAGAGAASRQAATGLVDHWRVATHPDRTEDELAVMLGAFLADHDLDLNGDVSGMVVSSGVPAATASLRRFADRYLRAEPVILGPGVRSGMVVKYDDPRAVGPDRIANAVGATDLHGGPAVVVDFGTATTFDVIDGEGAYLGGAILPGLEISLEALFDRAALLRQVDLIEPRAAVGRNTHESIQSGVIYGTAALVDGMVDRIETEVGDATVIATGGYAELIAPHSRTVEHHEPWLTLHGLRIVHEKNAP